MNLAETIYQKSLDLPIDKAIEVIDFIDFLKRKLPFNTLNFQLKENNLKALFASWSPLAEEFPEISDLPPVSEDIF
jgi:hypothetical protein